MNHLLDRFSRIYSTMMVLYPYEFRREFAREMQLVFQEKMTAEMEMGRWFLLRALWKELREWPSAVLIEYWLAFQDTFGRGIMSIMTEDRSWRIEDRRNAIIASLPPLMMGLGIALGALIIWEPWYTIPHWRLMTGFVIMVFPGLIIGLGGLWALIKRVPPWGHTWVGATGMGLVLFVKTIAEERADFGLSMISPVVDNVIVILLLIGIVVLIGVFAWQGWRPAGMVSLGFASMAGMASFSLATAAPLNRYDLALLAAPVGLVMSLLTYLFVRKGDLGRVISIVGFGFLNAFMLLVIAAAWDLPSPRIFPALPFLIVLTGALLVGPVAGLVGRPLRKVIQGS